MPAKRIPASRHQPKGFFAATYDTITDAENASIVRSIVIFGAAVTVLSSSWGEYLLPP
ncbi:hypothetical protein F5X68DRAFT_229626 [Plectosphaerella plurivora]|uniref:TOM core complex subunit Tom6 n=1 Tax=Plectosphaerella plurivora TaxID=936078 RepID=A0A9P8VFQ5_9PEZI|nr:hypothetical protein F5X68DRAFT_229626 [Plectosphaerella plurivora]